MTQAPSLNFVIAKMSATIPERKPPKPLMATPLRQPGSRCWRWWWTMPVCDIVKPANTPTA